MFEQVWSCKTRRDLTPRTKVRKCGRNAILRDQTQLKKITCLPSGALHRTWNEPDGG